MNSDEAVAGLYLVGDIHGDLAGLNRALWGRGLLRSGHWRAGTHLICVGDYTDRNPGGVAVLRLLRRLEEEGHATCLLGNHDVAMIGATLVARRHGGLPPTFLDAHALASARPDEPETMLAWLFHHSGALAGDATALAADEGLLAWLRKRPLVARRDDLLVVHADNDNFLQWGATIAEVNALGRQITESDSLGHLVSLFSGLTDRYAFLTTADGFGLPQDESRPPEEAAPARLAAMLARFGGRMLVHGHSVFSMGDAAPLVYAGGRAANLDRGAGYLHQGGHLCLCSRDELLARAAGAGGDQGYPPAASASG